ncbi:pirin family protein [Pelomonas sp. APW6]|uniref:Pirin family protein n=1 Tax=Roseateles subflavus TaxID=3053353 RepID=A0ABT7LM91_9BURK|nr:pirin family protein [Pelomonas sp. APW6]MDL5033981.1 pirin family protein [Pelomonas sp. APW6]
MSQTQLIRSCDRGYADHGWLKSFHSFSFADYYDPARMGFGALRVINEDRIAPGTGFGTHGHRDMEIISYVLDGELAHRDSMGNGESGAANAGVIRPGDVQRMSAGTGVLHSEFNHAKDRATHFLQIWIQPNQRGVAPGYEQKHIEAQRKRGRLALIAAPAGEASAADAVMIHANARVYAGLFDGDEQETLALPLDRLAYVHLVRGALSVNGQRLAAGDALQLQGADALLLSAGENAEVLVFDLAP